MNTTISSDTSPESVDQSFQIRIGQIGLVFLAAIVGAESVIHYVSLTGGLVFYLVTLLALVVTSAAIPSKDAHRFFATVMLAPLLRIVAIAMPLPEFSETYRLLIVSVPALAAIVVAVRVLDLRPADIGLSFRAIPFQFLIAIFGIALGLIDYLILEPEPLIETFSVSGAIVPALVLMVAVGLTEELALRGVIQSQTTFISRWGWLYVAGLYSALQLSEGSWLHCLFILFVGMFFGWAVKRSGSILGVIFSHGIMITGLYLVFPFVF